MVGHLQAAASPAGRRSPGEFMPIAFSVWDGFSRERGTPRGLTLVFTLRRPAVVPSAVGPMIRRRSHLAIELVVIGWVRWRPRSSQPRATSQQPPHSA
jgi:hypothetical protein